MPNSTMSLYLATNSSIASGEFTAISTIAVSQTEGAKLSQTEGAKLSQTTYMMVSVPVKLVFGVYSILSPPSTFAVPLEGSETMEVIKTAQFRQVSLFCTFITTVVPVSVETISSFAWGTYILGIS